MQTTLPGLVQETAPLEQLPDEVPLLDVEPDATGAAAEGAGATAEADEPPVTVAKVVIVIGALPALLAIMPLSAADVAGELADVTTAELAETAEVTAPVEAAATAPSVPAPAPWAMTDAQAVPTVELPRAVLKAVSTESPGDGKTKSSPSTLVHSVCGMFITNMSGRDFKKVMSPLAAPPVTVIGAQFCVDELARVHQRRAMWQKHTMYISRFPILLNQVHARLYSPFAIPLGIENSKTDASVPSASSERFPVAFEGHPPMMLWMTFHSLLVVGCLSVVTLTWQDPPPCVSPPMKLSACVSPTAMLFILVIS